MTEFQENYSKISRRRSKKSLAEQIATKRGAIQKHQEKMTYSQKQIEKLETDINRLEIEQQQALLQEYDMTLADLKEFLEGHKDQLKKGDEA